MNRLELIKQIIDKQSFLCVGLDSDSDKLPDHLPKSPASMLAFNKSIIDATQEYCVAYKINSAFYEALGANGWEVMEKTVDYIPHSHFVIVDAKRGDIGNTSAQYAKAFFDTMDADAVTVAPYMGEDSVRPFLGYQGKWVILLALTSNEGAHDFQYFQDPDGKTLYSKVLEKAMSWASYHEMMFVVGATKTEQLAEIRLMAPDYFLLIPGVGAQGGSLETVAELTMTDEIGILVNSSREIIFASKGVDFAEKAGEKAKELQMQMQEILEHRFL